MQSFWVTFDDGTKGSCEGEDASHAKILADLATNKRVTSVAQIPHLAEPVIWTVNDYGSFVPSFCYRPEECKKSNRCAGFRSCCD